LLGLRVLIGLVGLLALIGLVGPVAVRPRGAW
jgi:hypothetical protein